MMHARQLALSMMAAGVVVTALPLLAGSHSTSHAPAASLIGARKAQTYSKDLPAEPSAAKLYAIRATRLPVSTVTVRANDTLSTIAQRVWGDSSLWPDLWWANRQKVPNPDVLSARVLTLPAAHPAPGWRLERALAAIPAPPAPAATSTAGSGGGNASPPAPPPPAAGIYSFSALESLWVRAGGPSWAEAAAASIAECESGGDPTNYYGKSAGAPYTGTQAAGLWQILGQVVAGNIFDPYVNALNAVSKFRSSGDNFSQWVCTAAAVTKPGSGPAVQLASADAHFLSASTGTTPKRFLAFRWARRHIKGCPYYYGGNGPCSRGWDCSGAVVAAYAAVGISLPRTTSAMQRSWKLVRISKWKARKGDIVLWGSPAFHAELVAYRWSWTFGEHHSGTVASTVRMWSYAHYFYRVRHAG